MILQALYEYYQRKAADPESHIAPEGFQRQEIKFVIVIDEKGKFIDLQDTRDEKGRGQKFLLPKAIKRSGSKAYDTAFLLWDHYGYVLCHPKDGAKKSLKMAELQHKSFLDKIENLPEKTKKDKKINAVQAFYKQKGIQSVLKHRNWQECIKIPGCNLSFRLQGETNLIPESQAIKSYVVLQKNAIEVGKRDKAVTGCCLITGEHGPIVRLHTATPIRDSKSNATIVAFQKNAGYDSYGKEQAFNAPISIHAEAAYTTALKELISSSKNKVILGDSSLLFWAGNSKIEEKDFDLEANFAWFITESRDDPDRGIQAVKSLFKAVHRGHLPESNNRFYILSLAPNAARISIRYFRQGTVHEFGKKIYRHFQDFEIIKGPNEREYLSLYRILAATALQYKMENVPPNLAAAVLASVLDGAPYPITLLQQCMRRIRAERIVNRARAAILKATINRFNRIHKLTEKEITMALDLSNSNTGYRVGRLFAVLEKIQEEANPGINANIRDRFYGAASTSPAVVFPQLLKLKNHHLAKLENPGRRINFEKMIGDIFVELTEFPVHLALTDQAYFAIGYYHQRQDFFTSKKNGNETK